jgi:type I restriction enzyme, S subunit
VDNDWPIVHLGDVAEDITVGHVGPMASQYLPSGIPFLRSQDILPFRVNLSDIAYIGEEFHSRLQKSALTPGDVVIVRTGKPGTAAVIPKSLPVANCSDLVIVRPGKNLDPRFLAYYVNGLGSRHVASHLVGAVQQHFNVGSARQFQIPLPSIGEQRLIGAALGNLDEKIELNRRMNETLESIACAIFMSWFVDVNCPSGWRRAKLSDVCEYIMSGGTPSTKVTAYWNGKIPWLSSGETRSHFICRTDKRITQAGVENSSTRFARRGCTVIASAGQGHTRGQTSLLMIDSYINQSVIALAADHGVISDFYLYFDLQRRYEEFRRISDSQSSRGSLTTKLLADLDVVVPPRDLVTQFDDIAKPLVERARASLEESSTLVSLRDLLLPKVLAGEIRLTQTEKIAEVHA